MGILDAPQRTLRQQLAAMTPLRERFVVEGSPYNSGAEVVGGTFTADGNLAASFTNPGPTRAWFVDTITLTCNKNAKVQISFNETGLNGNEQFLWKIQTSPNIPVIIPVNAAVRPGWELGGPGSVKVRAFYDTDTTNVNFTAWANGWWMNDDFNFAADKTHLHIGDSITGLGTGITTKDQQYIWMVRKYFNDAGFNTRLVNPSVSGSTSVYHANRILWGNYDYPQVDFLSYSLGMNDAGQSISTSTYQTNVQNAIAWKQARYPNAKMLVFGPTPAQINTQETALVSMRSAASSAVSAANDPKIKFLDLGGSFDRTNNANYASSDAAGQAVHPSVQGHAAVFNVVKSFLDANPTFRP